MLPTYIQRLRFFDGQFLKEVDFNDEQTYHLHMRRRMAFALFEKSGVVPIEDDDLKFIVDAASNRFRVRAGMAISRKDTDVEGKEVVLLADSELQSLAGITGTAYVTIHYVETALKDPPSEGDVSEDTRFREEPQITIHTAQPPPLAPNDEEYILLGTLTVGADGTITEDYSVRQEARLRNAILSVIPPTVTGVSGTTSAFPNTTTAVKMTIEGTNLSEASKVTFSDGAVHAAVTSWTDTTVEVDVTVDAGAAPGPRTFTVTTPSGTASSPSGVVFKVIFPTISEISPNRGVRGTTKTTSINGNYFGDDERQVSFPPATKLTASVSIWGPKSIVIQVTIPADAPLGSTEFEVTTDNGTVKSPAGVVFTVIPPPSIEAIVPNTVAHDPVDDKSVHVTIYGHGLAGAKNFDFSGVAGGGVTEPGLPDASSTDNAVEVDLTISHEATGGSGSFQMLTDNGWVSSDNNGVYFTVT